MGAQAAGTGVESLIVVDTDIFIDHFRGVQSASDYLQNIPGTRCGVIVARTMPKSLKIRQEISNNLKNRGGCNPRKYQPIQSYHKLSQNLGH